LADGNPDVAGPRTLTLAQAFQEAALPEGTGILAEIHLLAWSLVGPVAGDADRRLALNMTTGPGDGLIHTVLVQNGAVVRDGWHERRPDGSGRHHREVPEDRRASTREVQVDLSVRPVSDRLRRIIAANPIPPPGPQLIQGALDCADRHGRMRRRAGRNPPARGKRVLLLEADVDLATPSGIMTAGWVCGPGSPRR
jgi:hypothetical protein